MGAWLQQAASSATSPSSGELQNLLRRNPMITNFQCTFGSCSANADVFENPDICEANPQATLALFCLANYVNYLYGLSQVVVRAQGFLDGETNTMVAEFDPPSGGSALSTLANALSIAGAVLGALGEPGAVGAAGTGIVNGILSIFAPTPPYVSAGVQLYSRRALLTSSSQISC